MMLKKILFLSLFVVTVWGKLTEINEKQLLEMKAEGVTIIDIRRVDEWKQFGIIEGANPLTFFDEKGGYDIPSWLNDFTKIVKNKEEPFIIYCAHANRTKIVGDFLEKQLRYKNIYELAGGINYGWLDKGMKTVKYK